LLPAMFRVEHFAHDSEGTDVKSKSVLIVDDDEQMLGLIGHWLDDAGYEVMACSRFETARDLMMSHPPDALVTDLRLGAYNGLQLALRASQSGPGTAVLVMSAYDDVVSRRDAAAFGGRFMLKPFDREALLAELSQAGATSSASAVTTIMR
jgi:DNA-binding response OmpR family regulator